MSGAEREGWRQAIQKIADGKETPINDSLPETVEKTVADWWQRKCRKRAQLAAQRFKHGGRTPSRAERRQWYSQAKSSAGLGEQIGKNLQDSLASLLGREKREVEEFAEILGCSIASSLQGDNLEGRLREVAQQLEDLPQEILRIAFEYYRIRRGFRGRDPSQTRRSLAEFYQEVGEALPTEGLAPCLFSAISHRFPDPASLQRRRNHRRYSS